MGKRNKIAFILQLDFNSTFQVNIYLLLAMALSFSLHFMILYVPMFNVRSLIRI